ncbi:c6 zinc finger domain containing protein [Apiospora arundinis]
MVGVKGKYKGCNTCRARRVKCDNTRPLCKKCTDHGRVCEGYERETVFIVGTVDDKGRCASHPPRNLGQPQASSSSPSPSRANSRKKQAKAAAAAAAGADAAAIMGSFSSSPSSSATSPQLSLREASSASPSAFHPLVPGRGRGDSFTSTLGGVGSSGGVGCGISTTAGTTMPATTMTTLAPLELWEPLEPLMPAWDYGDVVTLMSAQSPAVRTFHRVRFLALRTPQLDAVLKSLDPMTPEGQLTLTLPPSRHRDAASSMAVASQDEVGFRLSAQCFIHAPLRAACDATIHYVGGTGLEYSSNMNALSEGVCLFLYEHNASAAPSNHPPWQDPTILADPILSLGPLHFRSFPSHHLFARVYRPNAILTSLLARTPCHLASPEWATVPYELHPKSPLDSLFDLISVVPSLLHRADRILPLPPTTLGRRLKAKDLLANCISVEVELARWYARIEAAAAGNRDMPLLYWIHGSLNLGGGNGAGMIGGGEGRRHAQMPFADTYDFASTVIGLGHVYYWTALMLLYECMESLVDAVLYHDGDSAPTEFSTNSGAGFSSSVPMRGDFISPATPATSATPTINSSSINDTRAGMLPGRRLEDLLPPRCDPSRYQVRERRKLAANICRSLDWAIGPPSISFSLSSSIPPPPSNLRGRRRGNGPIELEQQQQQDLPQINNDNGPVNGHPDLALAPLHVVQRFYGALWSPDGRDGELERAWCCDFRARLEQRGREVEAWVGGRGGGGGRRGWVEIGRFG